MDFLKAVSALFFLLTNAVFVLIEFAIVRVRKTRIEEFAQNENNIFARTSLDIINNINSYLASIQLGITASSIGLGWIAQPYVAFVISRAIPDFSIFYLKISSYSISLLISFFTVTFFHIVFGEQVPKYIAISSAEKITLVFSIPLKMFYKATYYPMLLINKTSEFFSSFLVSKISDDTSHSEDEIKLILSKSEEFGRISLHRLMMFEHLFDFGKTSVKEVMVPVDRIVALKKSISFDDFLDTIRKFKFSRYPVIDENSNYLGYVHVKDVIINLPISRCVERFNLLDYIRPIVRVGEKEMIERVLRIVQETNQPILLVENDKKEITGIITVEDIIEDITGEIRDEFEKKSAVRLDEIFCVEGSVVDIKSSDRFSAINEMIDKLYSSGFIALREEISKRIIKREKELSTAIGHQIAVPHARIEGLKSAIISVGISKNGIDFLAPDLKPVKVIFLILSPYHEPSLQLAILSKISRLAMNITLRKKLFKVSDAYKIKEILSVFEDSIPVD
ncbi:MAG: CNNM domain-containing protein [Elusimicrobiales bacterium]